VLTTNTVPRRAPILEEITSALEAATLIGRSGRLFGTDISLPVLERAKRNAEGLPVKLVAMVECFPKFCSPGGA